MKKLAIFTLKQNSWIYFVIAQVSQIGLCEEKCPYIIYTEKQEI